MSNLLILEINRINGLMGIISEAPIGPWIDLADSIIKTFGKKVGKVSQLFDDGMQALKYAKTEEEAILALSKLSKASPEIAEKILPKVMQSLDTAEKSTLKQLENVVAENLKKGSMTQNEADEFIDEWVDSEVKTNFEGVKEIIKQDVKQNVKNAITPVERSLTPTKSQQKLVTQIHKIGSTWYSTLEKAGLSKWEIASVSKSAPFKKIRADVQLFAENIFNNRILGTQNAMNEMFGKLKTFTESLQEGVVDLNYIRDINITLQSFKDSSKLDVDILRKEIIKSLRNAKGPNGETIPYDIINKIDVYLGENIPTDIKNPSWISEWLPETSMGEFLKELTNSELKFETKFWSVLERGISFLTTGTFRKLDNFRDFWIKKGVPKGLVSMYVMVSITSKVVIPFIFGFMISLVQAIWANSPKGEGKPYAQRVWDLTMEKVGNALAPKDEDGSLNWIKTLVPFNFYWDNIYNAWDSVSKGEYKDIWSAILGKEKELEEKAEEIRKKGKEIIDKTEEKIESFTSEKFYEKYPCYTDYLDTTYNEDGFKNGVKIVGPTEISLRGSDNFTYNATLETDKEWHFVDEKNRIISCP